MKILFTILLGSLLAVGCAKNRDKENLRAGDTQDINLKSAFLGTGDTRTTWLTKMTVVDTSDSPSGTAFIGFQGNVKIGYFDFNQSQLQFRALSGLQEGNETENIKNPVLLNWDVEHLDFTLDELDGQTTNQQIFDNFKTWEKKKHFRIAWGGQGHNDTQMLPSTSFSAFSCWEPKSRRRVDNSMTIEEDHIGFKVEVVYQQLPACAGSRQWENGDFNFTVTYMYSFRKAEESDYKPKYFKEEQDPARYKYGHFQTVREVLDKDNGRSFNVFMENRWAEKTQYFYFVKGFPEKHKWMWDHKSAHSVLGQTNALLKSAGSKLRFEVYDYNHNLDSGDATGPERQFGDLRYSFLNFVEELEAGGTPLGYGPSDTHPFTGEIIAANTMVWTGALGYYLELMQKVGETVIGSDGKPKESSLLRQLKASLNTQDLDQFNTDWDQTQGIGSIFKNMAQKTRYGATFWNSYTADSTGAIQIPTVIEKYHPGVTGTDGQGFDGLTAGGFLNRVSQIIDRPQAQSRFKYQSRFAGNRLQLRVKNPYDLIDLGWIQRLAKSDSALANRSGGLGDFMKVLQNIQKTNDRNYKGPQSSMQDIAQQHFQDRAHDIEMNKLGHCILDMDEFAGGVAGFLQAGALDLSDEATKTDFLNTVLYRVSIHEFGHNLNLRHNFYGSVDQENFTLDKGKHSWSNSLKVMNASGKVDSKRSRVQISSSVMDYLRLEDEANTPWAWEEYDMAAILDSYQPTKFDDKGHLYLFCTDEHTLTSALCNRHDLGTTPSQILMSQIRSYDERYELRNKRFGRAYWNTGGYASRIFSTMMSMKEFLPMWRTGFAEDIMRTKMSDIGITNKIQQDGYLEEMNREMRQVMKVSMAFYQAVLQQSRGDRDFRSVYDETTGALKQVGIISDKLFAMYFLAGDDSIFYNPNRIMNHNSYLTYSREPGLEEFSERIWRNIVTDRNIAMEPWFINFARGLYAKNATNYNNRGAANLIDAMKIILVDNAKDLEETYGLSVDKTLPAIRTNLPFSKSSAFKAGDDVVVVHVNGSYYMTSVSEGHVTYSLFQQALDTLTGNGDDDDSVQQFNMDVREFYWLYSAASAGLLQ